MKLSKKSSAKSTPVKEHHLAYACRSFDSLEHGEEYDETPFVHHVGFLDFTLFPDTPEFFSTYRLTNIKHPEQIFNDKFTISVVDLTHTELATEEDKANSLDLWAKTFKATTWEEINMLAKDNEYIQSAVVTLAELTATKTKLASTKAELADKNAELAALRAELAALKASN